MSRIASSGLANADRNRTLLNRGSSIAALRGTAPGSGRCVVVAAGPSLKRNRVAEQLIEHQFAGSVVAADSALFYCLRNGLVPDLVVTLDPHADRIVRWFGDPNLTTDGLARDDYFRRQDMDRAFADELAVNEEVCTLIDEYGPQIRIALSTSASAKVVNRVLDSGMEVYWWNPMYDDPGSADSLTARLHRDNGLPCINAGGNVGTACWMMATEVLGESEVALTGVDFSYYADTPYEHTQYYHEAVELVGREQLDSIFMHVFNPHVDAWFYTDPAYMWYRECFLELAEDAQSTTYNCTEGGILFGEPIQCIPLQQFLSNEVGG